MWYTAFFRILIEVDFSNFKFGLVTLRSVKYLIMLEEKADPDQTVHMEWSDLGLHCLLRFLYLNN